MQFSLSKTNENELEIVKEIANLLNLNLTVIEYDEISNKDDLDDCFILSDAQLDLLSLKSLKKAQSFRKEQKYDIVLTGVAGELYKDFFWQQDFPFYSSSKIKLEKLFYYRFYPILLKDSWLGIDVGLNVDKIHNELLKQLEHYTFENNCKKYDLIYYNIRIKESLSIMNQATSNYLTVYSPFIEEELFKIGFNMKVTKRFFSNFHRNIITEINPTLASVKTTDGNMSISSKMTYKISDMMKYPVSKFNKLIKKIKPSSNFTEVSKVNNSILENAYSESRELLINAGILSTEFPSYTNEINESLVGRVITMGKFIQILKN